MKKFKKSVSVCAAAFAFCLVFALGVKVDAAQKELEGGILIDEGNLTAETMVGDMTTAQFAISSASLSTDSITVQVARPADADYVEVELCDRNGNHIASDEASIYASFDEGVKNNTVYMYRARAFTRDYDYTTRQYVNTYGNWSGFRTFVKIKCKGMKSTGYGSSKRVTFKTPKIKGVKKFNVTMSTKRDKGFKKVATVKPGKRVTVTKFNKKNLKRFKSYYFRVIPKMSNNLTSDLYGTITAY